MKNKGMVLIETLISITLFFIVVFPLLGFNQQLLHTNKKLSLIKLEHKNYQMLLKQLTAKGYENLSQHIGKHEFTLEDFIEENGVAGIILPKPKNKTAKNIATKDTNRTPKDIAAKNSNIRSKDKNITIEITPLYISSSLERYRYLSIKLVYESEVKTFSSQFITSGFEVCNGI